VDGTPRPDTYCPFMATLHDGSATPSTDEARVAAMPHDTSSAGAALTLGGPRHLPSLLPAIVQRMVSFITDSETALSGGGAG
jgi:hypothetical protein